MNTDTDTRSSVYRAEHRRITDAYRFSSLTAACEFANWVAPKVGLHTSIQVGPAERTSYAVWLDNGKRAAIHLTPSGTNVATILHEIAHLIADYQGVPCDHRRPFRDAHLRVVRTIQGHRAAEELEASYRAEGLE